MAIPKGYKFSEEHKRKLSEAHKGKMPKNFYSLHTPEINKKRALSIGKALKGRKFSKETLKKMSLAKLGKYIGENNPRWNGGREAVNARQKIKRRKIRICNECKIEFSGGYGTPLKWCEKCRRVTLECSICKNPYQIDRKFYDFRGSKVCGMECYGILRKILYSGENNPSWKGGFNHVIAYRARKRKAEGTHTLQEWEELKRQYDYMCLCCKKVEPEIKLSEDHVIPLSKGGGNGIENIQPLCRNCNSQKSARLFDYRNLFINYELQR